MRTVRLHLCNSQTPVDPPALKSPHDEVLSGCATRLMFFEQAREQAEKDFNANSRDAQVRWCQHERLLLRPWTVMQLANATELDISLMRCFPNQLLLTARRGAYVRRSPGGAGLCWSWRTSDRARTPTG